MAEKKDTVQKNVYYFAAGIFIAISIINQAMIGLGGNPNGLSYSTIAYIIVAILLLILPDSRLVGGVYKVFAQQQNQKERVTKRISYTLLYTFVGMTAFVLLRNVFWTTMDATENKDWADVQKTMIGTLSALFTTVIGYYFGSRPFEKEAEIKIAAKEEEIKKQEESVAIQKELLSDKTERENVLPFEVREFVQRPKNRQSNFDNKNLRGV